MLANVKIIWKIFGLVGLLLMVTVSVAGFSAYTMSKIGSEIEGIAEEDMPITASITQITLHQLEQAILSSGTTHTPITVTTAAERSNVLKKVRRA